MELLLNPQTKTAYEAVFTGRTHGYMFTGEPSTGRMAAAVAAARRFGCASGTGQDACGRCRLIDAGASPSVVVVAPADGKGIGVAEIRELIRSAALAPYDDAGRPVIIIDRAEAMSPAAQNALLKLAEEPPGATMLFLIVSDAATLLPTLRSRLGEVHFRPVAAPLLASWLERATGATPARSQLAAKAADGRPGAALARLADTDSSSTKQIDIKALLVATSFERLISARSLAEAGQGMELATRLHAHFIASAQTRHLAAPAAAPALEAVGRFRDALAANVGPRVALERLMLELPCLN